MVRRSKTISVDERARLQKLFCVIRKKALRMINNDDSEFCDLDPEIVYNHYISNPFDLWSNTDYMSKMTPAIEKINTNKFTKVEISKRLKFCKKTDSVPDGITYNHRKLIDSNAIVLNPLHNCCINFQAVSSSWKKTTAIFIYMVWSRRARDLAADCLWKCRLQALSQLPFEESLY